LNRQILKKELNALAKSNGDLEVAIGRYKEKFPGQFHLKLMAYAVLRKLIQLAVDQKDQGESAQISRDFVDNNHALLDILEAVGSGGLYNGLVIKYPITLRSIQGAMENGQLAESTKELLLRAGRTYVICRDRKRLPNPPYSTSEKGDILSVRWEECPLCSWMGKVRHFLFSVWTLGKKCNVCKDDRGWFWDPEK
jgi:hypothetical protein